MRSYVAVMLAFSIICTGCAPPVESTPPMKLHQSDSALVPAAPPSNVAADANPVAGPKPGQANDHSNPAFKSGGAPEPKK